MKISEINIYPIKSLKGIALSESVVEPKGLRLDRRWLVVDSNGKFLTQRERPQMALIGVEITNDGLRVTSPAGDEIAIDPLTTSDGPQVSAIVWNSDSEAIVYDDHVNQWFSDAIGQSVRLLYMPDDAGRAVNERFNSGGDKVSFADGYPLLLIGENSLADLNSRLPQPLEMRRFRTNLVVSGSDAFAEDNWQRIRVGSAVFRITKPCARCVITTVDPKRGEFDGKEPLKTLATFRMAKHVMPDRLDALGLAETAVLFGTNLIPENPGVTINVGDELEVID